MSKSVEKIKARITHAQKKGDYLKEYDLAQAALELHPDDEFFQYSSVLALARCNAKQRALDLFYSYKLNDSPSEYVRALEPRILKDLAFQSMDQAQPLPEPDRGRFNAAAVTYQREYEKTGGHYSAINAATLYMLSGDRTRALALAEAAIEIANRDQGPQYFPLANKAEACLLLNRPEEARRNIAEAARYNENNLLTRSRTYHQLRFTCRYLGIDPELLDPLLPETVIHYCGHIFSQNRPMGKPEEREMMSRIGEVLARRQCAIAYGSLAAGADIMVAEAILKQGGELNVWLPFGMESFCDELVRPYGEDWVQRFHECIGKAHTVSFATESDYLGESSLFNYCSDVSMGMAIMRANSLGANLLQVAVWDQVVSSQRSGTYTNIAKWQGFGHRTEIIPAPARTGSYVRRHHGDSSGHRREPHAILFADIRGYSRLGDRDVLWYFDVLQPALARIVERFRADIQHVDTWGDAVFIVTEKASVAARIAVEFNTTLTEIDQSGLRLHEPLLMRIGLHFGPVYKLYDHLAQNVTYSSNDVTKTARIEPVTPPGEVFGTEPFVAMLELEGEGWARFDYAGTIPSAKDFGAFRMFHIRPKFESPTLMCSLK